MLGRFSRAADVKTRVADLNAKFNWGKDREIKTLAARHDVIRDELTLTSNKLRYLHPNA